MIVDLQVLEISARRSVAGRIEHERRCRSKELGM